jgi:hypothetical protein
VIAPTQLELLSGKQCDAPDVRVAWRELLTRSINPNALFQSPEWFDNKRETKPREDLLLAVLRQGGTVTGIAPFLIASQQFDLRPTKLRLKTAQLLGGEGLWPGNQYASLFGEIFKKLQVDAIHLRLLRTESECWSTLKDSPGLVHVHDQMKLYVVNLPPTFDEYMGRFGSKHRKNLLRSVKLLREHRELRLQRIDSPEDVSGFLRAGEQVARASWQSRVASYTLRATPGWTEHLSDLARRGLLRSYLLWCAEKPVAYVLGYQGGGYYHYNSVGYDPQMAKFSPGTVMLLLVIEDLMKHDHPGKLHFGEGEEEYKRRFGTAETGVANVTVLRKTVSNRFRMGMFKAHRSARRIKRILTR